MTERELFLAALKLPTAGDRAAFLDQACGSDATLRGQIEALLTPDQKAKLDGFFSAVKGRRRGNF